jgi:threonine/homoserine/homoserine lactone efflux protein
MPTGSTMLLFSAAALALLVFPGPSVLYIISRSVDQGRRAGLASVLGIHTGSLVHVTAATVGLSALLVSSAAAFTIVKYVGAAYLIILGVRQIVDRRHRSDADVAARPLSFRRIYGQGVVVNVLNPKTAGFFFAFLPQFVDPDRGSTALQILIFGLTFIALGLLSDSAYAMLAVTLTKRLRRDARAQHRRRIASGGVLVALGVATAATGRHH